jgi:tetratricopeptide (TPR) repeat protein
LELITKALTLNPNEPAILDSMGWVQYRLGNLNAASDYLKRALAQFPDHEVAAHYGEVLWHTNQQEAAKQIWQKALNANPYSTPIKETLKRLNITLPDQNAETTSQTGTP